MVMEQAMSMFRDMDDLQTDLRDSDWNQPTDTVEQELGLQVNGYGEDALIAPGNEISQGELQVAGCGKDLLAPDNEIALEELQVEGYGEDLSAHGNGISQEELQVAGGEDLSAPNNEISLEELQVNGYGEDLSAAPSNEISRGELQVAGYGEDLSAAPSNEIALEELQIDCYGEDLSTVTGNEISRAELQVAGYGEDVSATTGNEISPEELQVDGYGEDLSAAPDNEISQMQKSNWKVIEIKPIEDVEMNNTILSAEDSEDRRYQLNACSFSDTSEFTTNIASVTQVLNSAECDNYSTGIADTEQAEIAVKEEREDVTLDIGDFTHNNSLANRAIDDLEHQLIDTDSPENPLEVKLEEDSMAIPKNDSWKMEETESNGCLAEESLRNYSDAVDSSDAFRECTEQVIGLGSVASPKKYPCSQCGRTFTSLPNLGDHLSKGHQTSRGIREACDICGHTFRYHSCLIRHKKKHAMERADICTSVSSTSATTVPSAKKRGRPKEGLPSNSDVVNYSMYSNKVIMLNLSAHCETPNANKPFKCFVCGNGYISRHFLERHIRKHKKNSYQMFPCSRCDKVFIRRTHLDQHAKEHVEKLRYICGICGDSCGVQASLYKHLREHKAKNSMIKIKHFLPSKPVKRTPESDPEIIMYPCNQCGMRFATPEYLAIHKKSNRHHLCNICWKGFKSQQSKLMHMKGHCPKRAVKGFFCAHCGKKFKRTAKLMKHLETHTLALVKPMAKSGSVAFPNSYDDSKQVLQNRIAAKRGTLIAAKRTECTASVGSISQGNSVEGGVKSPWKSEIPTNADVAERDLKLYTDTTDEPDASASTSNVAYFSCESDLKKYCTAIPRTETGDIKMEEVPINPGSTERDSDGVTDMQVSEGIFGTDSGEVKLEVPAEGPVGSASGISFPLHSTELGLEDQATTGFLEVGKSEVKVEETAVNFGNMEQMQLSYFACLDAVDETPQKCSVCGGMYKNHRSLAIHMQRHRQAKYTCDKCGEKFSTLQPMTAHKKMFHPRKIQFPCEICGRKCQKQSSLDEHREQHEFISKHISEGHKTQNFTVFKRPPNESLQHRTLYSCNFCPCIYASRPTMLEHSAVRHRK